MKKEEEGPEVSEAHPPILEAQSTLCSSSFFILLGLNQCLCLPKAELNTKNETKRPLFNGRLVSFLVFNSITHVGKKVTRLTRKTV